MKLFERLFGSRLRPDWEITPGGIIWKILVTDSGLLLGETRDVEKHEVSLFAVELSTGALLYSDVRLDEPWWIALEMVIGEIGVLHRYPKPDMPSVLGTTAVDARTGQVLWSDPTIRVACGTAEIALAQRGPAIEEGELIFVDARSGDRIETATPERAREFQIACESATDWSAWTSSEDVTELDARYPRLRQLLEREAAAPMGTMEVAELGDMTVVSAHVRSRATADAALNNRLDNVVLVIREGRVLWRETISSDLPHPSSDVFFVRAGIVYLIRDGHTLVALNINLPQE